MGRLIFLIKTVILSQLEPPIGNTSFSLLRWETLNEEAKTTCTSVKKKGHELFSGLSPTDMEQFWVLHSITQNLLPAKTGGLHPKCYWNSTWPGCPPAVPGYCLGKKQLAWEKTVPGSVLTAGRYGWLPASGKAHILVFWGLPEQV